MVQQSEKTEGNTVAAETKKSPKKRAVTKRKKKSTTASSSSATTTRRQRVKRTRPASQSAAAAAKSKTESGDAPIDDATVTVAKVSADDSSPSPANSGATNDASNQAEKPTTRSRTLKRAKPRAASSANADAIPEGVARKSGIRRKKPSSQGASATTVIARSEAGSVSANETSIPGQNAPTAQKSKEPFGAGIVRDRGTSADGPKPGDATSRTAPPVESKLGNVGSDRASDNRSNPDVTTSATSTAATSSAGPSAESETKAIKKKSRRTRGGKAKRMRAATAANTATAANRVKDESPESGSRESGSPGPESKSSSAQGVGQVADHAAHAGETEEERTARIVLKRRPVRRARRSKSRSKSETNFEAKSETQSSPAANAAPATQAKAVPPTPAKDEERKSPGTEVPSELAADSTDQPRKSNSTRNRRRRRGQGKSAQQPTPVVAEDPTEDEEEIFVDAEVSDDITVITDDSPVEKAQSEGREMIINSTAGAECRIAILHDGRLEEIYIERQSAASHVGNIYKGKITNVESSIQAAFVDFGLAKNGFLHISDVLPKYFPNKADATEDVGKKVPRRDRPPIQKCFRRGDEVIVQVAKEGVGTKGPTLTTYLSIPGRFVVMMPGMSKLGVSRRIEDDADRKAMRDLLSQLSMPDGMGFILRTAGLNRNKRELQSDLNYLNRLWKTVEKRIKSQATPCELYQESDLVIRTIRDVYSSDFKRIVVDDLSVAVKAKDFLRIAMPRTQGAVVAYQKHEPIFHHYGIEQEIQRIYSRHVPLPSGGSIVIDSTEAMVAIDVNSGKYRDQNDAEETAYRINIEAAEEIARQLRLRDLGGLVVCDFIDMRQDRHKRAVEKALRDALKLHKERARILRMSKFGLIEMTRQRQGPSIKRSVFVDCRHCSGSGLVKTAESMSLEVLRVLQLLTHRGDVAQVAVSVAPDVCALVLNQQRAFLHYLESKTHKSISILPDPTFTNDEVSYKCIDDRGMPLRIEV
jgi:ribonuclease E